MRIRMVVPSMLASTVIFSCILGFHNAIFALLGVGSFFSVFLYEIIKWRKNRKGEVAITTPDGSNQPYHPSVLYFKNGWNGYHYWMAYTPFPIDAEPYQDRWEYPCIAVSEDGVNWIDGNGGMPLDDLTEKQIVDKDYFSDTHLVYNARKNQIECYYRLSEESHKHNKEKGVWIFRRTTKDGMNWSEREISISPEEDGVHGDFSPAISPAIIIDHEKYKMWYVIERNQKMTIHLAESNDGIVWDNEKDCTLVGYRVNPWHLDCKKFGDVYWMITYDFSQRLVLWTSCDGVEFNFVKVLLMPSKMPGSFYKTTLYRACIMKNDDYWYVYFSAGNERKVKIGLMRGTSLETVEVLSASEVYDIHNFIVDLYEKYFFVYRWLIWKMKRKLHIQREGKTWF